MKIELYNLLYAFIIVSSIIPESSLWVTFVIFIFGNGGILMAHPAQTLTQTLCVTPCRDLIHSKVCDSSVQHES